MILCPISRLQLLAALPRQAAVAEIGVAEGVFSQEILRVCEPSALHLIDPWEWQSRDDYRNDANNADMAEQQRRFQMVSGMFSHDRRVSVIRAYSTEAVHNFADGSLDWVYVDAVHSYEGALADLRAFLPKVKADGLILGHDFANHPDAQAMEFGVIEAVETFVAESGCRLLLVTDEVYPTFVIAKNPDGPTARGLMDAICYNVPHLVEFHGKPTGFRQRVVTVADRTRVINGFAAE